MDRISNLPLSLLETILCLLPYHEVVRTSTLSKEWRYHWTDVTKIVVIEDTRTLNRIKLLSGVSQALLMHKGPIHEVTLSVAKDDHWGFDTAIRRIISHLSSKKAVKKLTVDFGSRGYHNSLPISLLDESITHNFYDYNGVTYTNLFESLMLIESLTICPEIIEIMNANWRGCSLALEEDIWMEHLSELEIIYISSEQTELDFVKLILMRSIDTNRRFEV
ncbi:F-box/FBD/LRR-repeat protein-like protein [Tanacetum coccineum]|uniref:F-box/FBD/LRR-repeat protein-like protein n=1 Tax=Tanacetum coccineum TaxID=301880 RepID=A0ABQ4XDR8_9ASTR